MMKCPKCGGAGRVDLPEVLRQTFQVVHAFRDRGGVSAESIHGTLIAMHGGDFSVTAVNNRLEHLRKLGLVRRKTFGRGYRYFPKKTAKP